MKTLTTTNYLSILSYGISLTIIGPLLGSIQTTFTLSEGELGLFTVSLSVGLIISVFWGGYIVDRFSIKRVGISGQLLLSLGLFLFSLTNIFFWGMAAFFAIGIGGGLIEIVTNTLISDLYRERRASGLNLLHGFFGIGALVGPLFAGFLLDARVDWQRIYQIVALFSTSIIFLYILSQFPRDITPEKIDLSIFATIFKSPYTLLLGIIILLYVGAEMGITYWSVLYMKTHLKFSTITASSFLTYFWVAITVGRFICYGLGKRVGEKVLLLLLSVGAVFSYGLFILSETVVMSGISLVLVGFCFSGVFPTIIAIGGSRYPAQTGTINGFLMTFMGLGILISPPLMGMVSEAYTLKAGISLVLILILFLALSGSLLFHKRFSSPTHPVPEDAS
jgi:fucose permease